MQQQRHVIIHLLYLYNVHVMSLLLSSFSYVCICCIFLMPVCIAFFYMPLLSVFGLPTGMLPNIWHFWQTLTVAGTDRDMT